MEHVHSDIFRQVAGYLGVRDLKAISITCRTFSDMVHHDESTLWKDQFYRRWNKVNFMLDPTLPCVMSESVRQEYHTDSACYRFLSHFVFRVPMFADVNYTHMTAGLVPEHRFRVLEHATGRSDAPLTIAYDGNLAGSDRCVRANTPFCNTLHATVHRRRDVDGRDYYAVGVTRNGYFEVTIRPCEASPSPDRPATNVFQFQQGFRPHDSCVAIGVADSKFRVIRNQPGWRGMSFGYHSDDGNAFHQSSRGQPHGPTFGAGDTVGCLLVDHSTILYTCNGQAAGPPIPCYPSSALYPVVGVDSPDAVEWNFGHKPFAFDVLPHWETEVLHPELAWEDESNETDASEPDDDDEWTDDTGAFFEGGYTFANEDDGVEFMEDSDWSNYMHSESDDGGEEDFDDEVEDM